jgi:hypothetical protein
LGILRGLSIGGSLSGCLSIRSGLRFGSDSSGFDDRGGLSIRDPLGLTLYELGFVLSV